MVANGGGVKPGCNGSSGWAVAARHSSAGRETLHQACTQVCPHMDESAEPPVIAPPLSTASQTRHDSRHRHLLSSTSQPPAHVGPYLLLATHVLKPSVVRGSWPRTRGVAKLELSASKPTLQKTEILPHRVGWRLGERTHPPQQQQLCRDHSETRRSP